MTALAVVVALDPEGQIALQLLRSDQLLAIVIEVQLQLLLRRSLQLEGGEQALRNSVIPTAALGGHAAADLVLLQQDPVTARKDDARAADQAAITNVVGMMLFSGGG